MKKNIAICLSVLLGSTGTLSTYGGVIEGKAGILVDKVTKSEDEVRLDELRADRQELEEYLESDDSDYIKERISLLDMEIGEYEDKLMQSRVVVTPNAGAHITEEFSVTTQAKITTFVNNDGTWYYYLDANNGAVLVDYVGLAEEITIPTMVNGHNVVEIQGYDGQGSVTHSHDTHGILNTNTTVKTINITHNVRLGNGAFKTTHSNKANNQLQTVNGGQFVIELGEECFSYQNKLVNFDLNSALQNISEVGKDAFWGCKLLDVTLDLRDNITRIGAYAFYDCVNLKGTVDLSNLTIDSQYSGSSAFQNTKINEVIYNSNLDNAPMDIFSGCTELTKAMGFSNVTTLLGGTFENCSKLAQCDIDFTKLVSIGYNSFKNNKWVVGTVDIRNATSLYAWAFEGCVNMTDIELSGSINELPVGIFKGCTGMTRLPDLSNITILKHGVFEGCTGLVGDIDISNIPTVGNYVFKGCSNIETVKLNNNITELSWQLFKGCTNLREVTGLSNITSFDSLGEVFSGCTKLNSLDLRSENISIWCYTAMERVGKALSGSDSKLDLTIKGTLESSVFRQAKLGTVTLGTVTLYVDNSGLSAINVFENATIDKLILTEDVLRNSVDTLRALFGGTTINELVIPDGAVIDNLFNDTGLNINKITFEGSATVTNSFKKLASDTVLRGTLGKDVVITDSFGTNLVTVDCTYMTDETNNGYNFSFNITTSADNKLKIHSTRSSQDMNIVVNGKSVFTNLGAVLRIDKEFVDATNGVEVVVDNGEVLFGNDGSILRRKTAEHGRYYMALNHYWTTDYLYGTIRDHIAPLIPNYTLPALVDFKWTMNGVDAVENDHTAAFKSGIIDFNVNTIRITTNIPNTVEFSNQLDAEVSVTGIDLDTIDVVVKDDTGAEVGRLGKVVELGITKFKGLLTLGDVGTKNLVIEVVEKGTGTVLQTTNVSVRVTEKTVSISAKNNITKSWDNTDVADVTLDDFTIIGLPVGVDKNDIINIDRAYYDSSDVGENKAVTVEFSSKNNNYVVSTMVRTIGSITPSNTVILDSDVVYNNMATYGDTIEIKVKPSLTRTYGIRAVDTVELYKGNSLIATSNRKDGDYYVIEYDTTDKKLEIGENDLTLRFTGNGSMLESSKDIKLTLSPKVISATYDLQYEYDGLTEKQTQLNIVGIVNNDVLDNNITLHLDESSVNVGGTPVVVCKVYNINNDYYSLADGDISGNIVINKADITNNNNGTNVYKQQVSIRNKYANTYTISIPLDVIYGKAYGNITYSTPNVTESVTGYLVNGVTLNGNNLEFEVNDVNSNDEITIATAEVVLETTNYNDVTYILELVSVNKEVPILNIKPIVVDYGTNINDNIIKYTVVDGQGNTIDGNISVVGGGILDVGNHTITVTFTPNDNTTYDIVTVQVNVNINKAMVTMQKPPTVSEPTKVDNTLKDFTFIDNGEYVDKNGNIVTGGIIEWVTPDVVVTPNTEYEFIYKHPNYEFMGTIVPYPTDKLPIKLPSGEVTVFPNGSLIVGKTDTDIDFKGNVKVPGLGEIQLPNGDIIIIKQPVIEYSNGLIVTLPVLEIPTFDKDTNLVLPSGSKYPDNNGEVVLPNGGIVLPDGTIKPNFPILIVTPGNDLILPDGTTIPNNTGYTKDPNGNVVINVPNNVLDKLPGGGSIVLTPDGDIKYEPIHKKEEINLPNGGIADNGTIIKPTDKLESIGKPLVDNKGNIILPNGGIVTRPDGSQIQLPSNTVVKPIETITLPNGGVTDSGVVINPADKILTDSSFIKNPNGSITLPNGGLIQKPDGSTVQLPNNTIITPNTNTNNTNTNNSSNNNNNNNSNISGVIINQGNTSDINNDKDSVKNWYDDILASLKEKGIINDSDLGNLNGDITRGEFAKYIVKLLEIEYGNVLELSKEKYKDIDITLDEHKAIMQLNSVGIFLGYGNGTMKPTQTLTREEMAVVVSKLADYVGRDSEEEYKAFSDIDSAAFWSKDYIIKLQGYGIVEGLGNGNFEPKKAFTKVEAFSVIYKLCN